MERAAAREKDERTHITIAIIWALIFAAGGVALGAWVGGTIGTILIFVGFILASMSIQTGRKQRGE